MDTLSAFGLLSGDIVRSEDVAGELIRRGESSGSQAIRASMEFIAGRLPRDLTTAKDVATAVEEAFLISRENEDTIVSLSVGAFSEARF